MINDSKSNIVLISIIALVSILGMFTLTFLSSDFADFSGQASKGVSASGGSSCKGSSTKSCTISNGVGQMSRICSSGVWSAWSTCIATSCNSGYTLTNGQCIQSTSTCTPVTEICGNNIDEDCNGSDLACVVTCTPTSEICDGKDNDCDGFVDNGITCTANTPISGATFTTIWQNNDWYQLSNWTYNGEPNANPLDKWWKSSAQYSSYITIGDTTYKRNSASSSVHYYHDGLDERVELHSARKYLGVKEGSTVYMGWSDYYTILPIHDYTTFQWRDEDTNVSSVNRDGYPGCPVIQFTMMNSYYGFKNSTNGTSIKGIGVFIKEGGAPGGKGVITENLKTNQWYDYVVAIKYAKDSTGYFKVWAGPAGTLDYAKAPTYSYNGPTMYGPSDLGASTQPCGTNPAWGDIYNSPQLRMGGAYQWGTRAPFESYKGPLRINVGETGQTAFNKVVPR